MHIITYQDDLFLVVLGEEAAKDIEKESLMVYSGGHWCVTSPKTTPEILSYILLCSWIVVRRHRYG